MIDWLEHHLTVCFFKSWFGIDCPTCGMQRALIALLKGNMIESFHHHAALIPLLFSFTLLIIQLKMKSDYGYKIVIGAFLMTFSTIIIQYTCKLYFT